MAEAPRKRRAWSLRRSTGVVLAAFASLAILSVSLAGSAAAVLIGLGLLVAALGLHHFVLRPLLELHEAVVEARANDAAIRAPGGGSREIADLADAFNELSDAQRDQRQRERASLARLAHDLRTPLSGLKLVAFALREQPTAEGRAHALQLLDRQLDELSRMVEHMTDGPAPSSPRETRR